jgi:8-oxo-dGTP pyrophosphatase MutT (NUDIX family)
MQDLQLRVAAKAVITNDKGEVLIVREAKTYKDGVQTGKYGMPGGRLEPGESFLDGLAREVREETGLVVTTEQPVLLGEWRPVIRGVPHQVIAIFMACRATTTNVRLSDEHDDYQWIDPRNRRNYAIMSPDCDAVDAVAARQNLVASSSKI